MGGLPTCLLRRSCSSPSATSYRITLRGIVHERMFNGPKLELTTELSTEPGSRTFRLSDAVTNRGGMRQEFQILYHTNFGPPLLEDEPDYWFPPKQ